MREDTHPMQATRRRTQEERDLQPSSIASEAEGGDGGRGANPRPPRGARGKEGEEEGRVRAGGVGRRRNQEWDSVVGWDWSRNLGFRSGRYLEFFFILNFSGRTHRVCYFFFGCHAGCIIFRSKVTLLTYDSYGKFSLNHGCICSCHRKTHFGMSKIWNKKLTRLSRCSLCARHFSQKNDIVYGMFKKTKKIS